MNIEQEREAFEASYKTEFQFAASRPGKFDRDANGDYEDVQVLVGWRMWQAGRAALQSQDREDASEWLKQHEALMHRVSKAAMVVGYGGSINGADPEIALQRAERLLLDHARRIEGTHHDQ